MRIFHELVFDDFITGGGYEFSQFHWAAVMGNFETLRIITVADSISGTNPTLFLALNETPDISIKLNTATILLGWVSLVPGQSNTFSTSFTDADPGMPPSYATQFVCILGGTSPAAHVRVWVTGRGKA